MKMISVLALLGLAWQTPLSTGSRAFIELQTDDELTTITAKFANESAGPVTYDYLLTVTKRGKSGEVNSAQGGEFSAGAGQTVTLSSSATNFSPSDAIELKLEVMDAADKVIYEDRWHRAPEK